ncbi:hypothetical protein [Magnetofaba australis]|uniref:Uncharacterized protein n=1 Tax=Magnetofaba australis IT-1 TaxID=1434232 RepID=A0A1Y2K947_9PROT|nr:hypothetical protein [Magnetofaba australis]OSM07275.1 hypothetical protein MAIT1_04505 [Magnetofaba australis IT-1]
MQVARAAVWHIGLFVLMIASAIVVDLALHWSGRLAWGRYLGYVGSLSILLAFLYSLRKRKVITVGRPARFLAGHEILSWLGAMLVLAHGGIHANALLPWLAMAAMLTAVASGLTGKYLLQRSREIVRRRQTDLRAQGLSAQELEERLYWDAAAVSLMKQWRVVHLPITAAFVILALLHVVTILLFWRW